MRYMNLAWILLMRRISDQIADRFKQMDNYPQVNDEKKNFCQRICGCHRKKRTRLKHAEQHPWSISQVSYQLKRQASSFLNLISPRAYFWK